MRKSKRSKRTSLSEVKTRICGHIKTHPGIRTSKLITDLNLDPDLAIKAVTQLRDGGLVLGKVPKTEMAKPTLFDAETLADAKNRIRNYVKAHSGVWISELITSLSLDPELAVEALDQLRAEGFVVSRDVQTPDSQKPKRKQGDKHES